MADGISIDGGVRPAAPARAVPTERAARADTRPAEKATAAPVVRPPVLAAPADAIALGQARDRIAATLSEVNSRPADVMPLSPGAGDQAIAAAQALAELIAANAHPTIAAQAHLSPEAVRMAIELPTAR